MICSAAAAVVVAAVAAAAVVVVVVVVVVASAADLVTYLEDHRRRRVEQHCCYMPAVLSSKTAKASCYSPPSPELPPYSMWTLSSDLLCDLEFDAPSDSLHKNSLFFIQFKLVIKLLE